MVVDEGSGSARGVLLGFHGRRRHARLLTIGVSTTSPNRRVDAVRAVSHFPAINRRLLPIVWRYSLVRDQGSIFSHGLRHGSQSAEAVVPNVSSEQSLEFLSHHSVTRCK